MSRKKQNSSSNENEAVNEKNVNNAPGTDTGEPQNTGNAQSKENRSERIEADDSNESDAYVAETEALEAELRNEKEKYLRLYAEYENFRRRSQKERDAIYSDVRVDAIKKILPIFDNLTRALNAQCSDSSFYKGVEMTMTQLQKIFDDFGVIPIEAVGKPFDPSLHNAVLHIEDENYGKNEIVEEFEKGFMLGDKVIRFSMVKVAN